MIQKIKKAILDRKKRKMNRVILDDLELGIGRLMALVSRPDIANQHYREIVADVDRLQLTLAGLSADLGPGSRYPLVGLDNCLHAIKWQPDEEDIPILRLSISENIGALRGVLT